MKRDPSLPPILELDPAPEAVTLGQVVYAGDDVSGERHEHRHWDKPGEIRERLFSIAAEACLRL